MNKKSVLKKIITCMMIMTFMLAFVGCGKVDTLKKVKDSGKLVIGTCADYPPYEFHKNIDGKDAIVGFDIEIARAIANDLGVELEIKDMKFDGLLAALKTGNIDLISAGMSPTPDRAKEVDFTNTYYTDIQKILVRAEDVDKLKKLEDFNEKNLGVQKASIQEDLAKAEMPTAKLKSLGKITDLVLELKNKKVEGIVLVAPVADAYAKQNDDLVVLDMILGEDSVAIAVDKGNESFIKEINKTVDRLQSEKTIEKLIKEATELSDK
ncbi:transporter substrate-binding domain-containing protein [Lutibacter sp. B2]|nr:transporter substrate-binding domain-containing protein [Lutibacter sp. B2]